jgi:hypothetical protein
MADTGIPIHVLISEVPVKVIIREQPAAGLRPTELVTIVHVAIADPGQSETSRLLYGPEPHPPGLDRTYQHPDAVKIPPGKIPIPGITTQGQQLQRIARRLTGQQRNPLRNGSTVRRGLQAVSLATEAVPFSEPSQTEVVQFNAVNPSITGARSNAAAVRNLLLLYKRAAAEAAEVVQFHGANQAKAGAQSRAAVVVGIAETNGAAAVHHEEGELTDSDFDSAFKALLIVCGMLYLT